MEEILENRSSLAAPVIFLLAVILQLMSSFIGNLKKRGSVNAEEIQLRQEIKGLLKEASSLSNPSTFAQAAKLRRKAAAKEKELRKSQELHNKENKLPYATCVKALMVIKVVSYLLLVVWFWSKPVAVVSQQLLQPFGRLLDASRGQLRVNVLESEVVYLMKLAGQTRDKLESDQGRSFLGDPGIPRTDTLWGGLTSQNA